MQAKLKSDYNYGYNNNKNISKKGSRQEIDVWMTIGFIIVALIILATLVIYISHSLAITQLNYQLADKQAELSEIEQGNHQLSLELAQSTSLARIEKIARAKLHMVEPEEIEVVVLNNNNNEQKEIINNNRETFFLVKVFDSFIEKINTVKASGLK